MQVASSNIGAVGVSVGFTRRENFVSELTASAPRGQIVEDRRHNEALIKVIENYLKGVNPLVDLAWDIDATPFRYDVWRAACTIPYGETRSYKYVACMVGRPKGARAVGQALKRNPLLILIPCHRVVSMNGLGGFGAGLEMKRYLVNLEHGECVGRYQNRGML